MSWADAHDALRDALRGSGRREILDRALAGADPAEAVRRLGAGMRAHRFGVAAGELALDRIVAELDAPTRAEGFHVLLEWDHASHRFIPEDIAVLMLDYCARSAPPGRPVRTTLALLLDYYFLYLLALLALRIWDEGDPNANLDRVGALLGDLGGSMGSGRRLVEDAATLLFLAISGYEPDDFAYPRLLEKVARLDEAHRVGLALVGAPLFGCHLRWGFPALYRRDFGRMREDNFVDYPWLFTTVATLMERYDRLVAEGDGGPERDRVVEALLNGLSADPEAFTGEPPACLAAQRRHHDAFRVLLRRHRGALLHDIGSHRPRTRGYSPLAFHVNFPHNALIAMVVLATTDEATPNVPLDALFAAGSAAEAMRDPVEALARSLTAYAAAHPEHRGERRVMMVAYDPEVGLRSFERVVAALAALG